MISAVFSEEIPKKVIDIPLERIETNPTQPRRFFDLEALAELPHRSMSTESFNR